MQKVFERAMTLIYLLAGAVLALMSVVTILWSAAEFYTHILRNSVTDGIFISTMLQYVGAIIVSVAIFDVARYVIDEELFRKKELRSLKETRETLSKIMTIVAIAVSIEGLIFVFKVGAEDIRLLIYPVFLILSAVVIIIGLAFYQRCSVETERAESAE